MRQYIETERDMYENVIKHYPDFPIPGIDFIDIMPFLQDREKFNSLIRDIDAVVSAPNVATAEARGFLFAAPLLTVSDKVKNIVPVRKKGKLPFAKGDLKDVAIMKEYGADHVYYRLSDIAAGVPNGDTFEVTFLDDILATGGTAEGIATAMNKEIIVKDGREYKVKVTGFVFLVELASEIPGAAGRLERIAPVHSIIKL